MTKALALSYAAPNTVTIESAHMETAGQNEVLCLSAVCGSEIQMAQLWLSHHNADIQRAGHRALVMLFDAIRIPATDDPDELVFRTLARHYWDQVVDVYEWQIAAMAAPTTAQAAQKPIDAGRYVYVISCPETDSPMCKIGIASSPERRIRQLSTSSPHRLRIEMARYSEHARSIEAELHSHFAAERQNGEWFAIDPETAISCVNMLIANRSPKA